MKSIFFIVLAISFTSCKKEILPEYNDSYHLEVFDINSTKDAKVVRERIDLYEEFSDIYYDLVVSDSLLMFISEKEPFLHIFDLESGNKVWDGLEYGRGPMNFETPDRIIFNSKSNKISVLDLSLRRIISFPAKPSGIVNSEFEYTWIPKEIGLVTDFDNFEGDFLSTGFFNNTSRYMKIFRTDSIEKSTQYGSLPKIEKELSPHVYQQAYTSFISFEEEANKIAIANRYTNILEIYSKKGELLTVSVEKNYFPPVFEESILNGFRVFASGPDLQFGFIDIETTPDFIFTLYSGKPRKQGEAFAAEYLLIFDWKGKLLSKVKLNYKALGLTVGNENSAYTINNSREETITKYTIAL